MDLAARARRSEDQGRDRYRRGPIEITLANRDAMGFRMLLGRAAVRGIFHVDPGRSFYGGRPARKRKKKPVAKAIIETLQSTERNVLVRSFVSESRGYGVTELHVPGHPEENEVDPRESGGFLRFHTSPGDIVREGDPIATNTSLLGREEEVMTAPLDAAVLGMTTLPAG